MASYLRAQVIDIDADDVIFGFIMPVSNPDGSGHEFLYRYTQAKYAVFSDDTPVAPTSGSIPGMNAAGSVYKAP